MKKSVVAVILVLCIVFPVYSLSDGNLKMTMSQIINSYNQVSAPLGSPYKVFAEPDAWNETQFGEAAIFYVDEFKDIAIALYSNDKRYHFSLDSIVDEVRIIEIKHARFPAFLSAATRVVSIFKPIYQIADPSEIVLSALQLHYEQKLHLIGGNSYFLIDELYGIYLNFAYLDDESAAFSIKKSNVC